MFHMCRFPALTTRGYTTSMRGSDCSDDWFRFMGYESRILGWTVDQNPSSLMNWETNFVGLWKQRPSPAIQQLIWFINAVPPRFPDPERNASWNLELCQLQQLKKHAALSLRQMVKSPSLKGYFLDLVILSVWSIPSPVAISPAPCFTTIQGGAQL